eukprot:6196742-Pleurochrysis_carterae.AAC.2
MCRRCVTSCVIQLLTAGFDCDSCVQSAKKFPPNSKAAAEADSLGGRHANPTYMPAHGYAGTVQASTRTPPSAD